MAKRQKKPKFQENNNIDVNIQIKYINKKQKDYIESIYKNDITFGIGSAGTGKTYVAALLGMKLMVEKQVDKIIICRPAISVEGEDIGYLPGNVNEKMNPYIQPIFDAFRTFWDMKTIRNMIYNDKIEIVPLAYMRGRSFKKCFIIADEIQNATESSILMLLTRLAEGSKMVITGDPKQKDISENSLIAVKHRLATVPSINFVYFDESDVVRHKTVENILKAWDNNEIILRKE